MGNLKLLSWNLHGFKRISGVLAQQFTDFDIVCFQETWLRQYDENLLASVFPLYNCVFKSSMLDDVIYKGRPFGGLCIMWDKKLDAFCVHVEVPYDNIDVVALTVNNKKLYVVNVYFPYACNDNQDNIDNTIANLLCIWELYDCDEIYNLW